MPNTVIVYVSESKYIILKGGEANIKEFNENCLTESEQSYADLHLKRAIEYSNASSSSIIWVSNPKPNTGTIIEYDTEGFIKNIRSKNISQRSALPIGTTSPVGTYVWGSLNNTLTVTATSVRGTGRATTYGYSNSSNDVYDQYSNVLKKGDIATRQDYDNPAYGTSVIVVAARASDGALLAKYMSKVDIGALPNAIIDIWKSGVEYWGYTPSTTLSLYNVSYSYNR
ncbi:MAG: hypothetical protein VB009_04645 [Erysipelotrichaceae bacterium]|nr:hypothetical protein [Erysipelotrichaceae bacterium]